MNENNIYTVGSQLENFEFETYDPVKNSFSRFLLKDSMEQKRWTVLVYYPSDFTFVCPTELKDLADNYNELYDMGVNVLSVSTDTIYVHMAWKAQEKLLEDVRYPMATDKEGRLAKKLSLYNINDCVAYRGTVIIDPNGIITGIEININSVGRNMSELVRKMKAFIYTYKNPREVCPAKWEPGKKTLSPSEKIVGKIYEELK
ncbi:MAG: redoxin domain-containing protein [Elusimicrobia bacterium]|jgi:peroxiredoxin (alkyl hydroperoxide reductase subunit C)|nr:redoxin domain-containing protein [Elusimicrobiota bacterium]